MSAHGDIDHSNTRDATWPRSLLSKSVVIWWGAVVGLCVIWTVAVAVWLSPSELATAPALSRSNSVLTAMATLSGAAIVLALTAVLVGLQMVSRFGSRASRTVTTTPVAALVVVAGLLGVALPLWAAAEPWPWLRTAGLAGFAWTILALGAAVSSVLAHLNPRWLAVRQVERLYRCGTPKIEANRARLRETQSVLLEIADGAPEGDLDGSVAHRAIAYVSLANQRLTGRSEDISELTETLGARARSVAHRGQSPARLATLLSLVGAVSDDDEVGISVLRQQSDLAQDAIAQRRHTVVRELLNEAAAFATDRLRTLLEPATIGWLTDQAPVTHRPRLHLTIQDREDSPLVPQPPPQPRRVDRHTVITWIEDTTPPSRHDAGTLAAFLPPAKERKPPQRVEAEVIEIGPTLVTPDLDGTEVDTDGGRRDPEEPIVIADLADYVAGATAKTTAQNSTSGNDQLPDPEWPATLERRHRQSAAYDVLEAIVENLTAACAAPNPDEHSWPGGWRGSGAFTADITRLAGPALALYQSGCYSPTDRVEAAIEDLVSRLVRTERTDAGRQPPSDPIGWRVPEDTIRPKAAEAATEIVRELAIEAWRAGFDRRALLTIRRLIALFTTVAARGDATRAEEIAQNLRMAVIRTAQWSGDTIAERWRSRQLVLALAPEISVLGRAVAELKDDATWATVFAVLDTIGWSPLGSASEGAAEVYLHFLAGLGAPPDEPYFGRPWEVVSWGWHPCSSASQLPEQVMDQLFEELHLSGTLEQPRLALLSILALWRNAILAGTSDRIASFHNLLQESILDHGRRDFEPDGLWDPAEPGRERPPRFDQPLVHWRVFDVALAASEWCSRPESDRGAAEATLPPVLTPDGDLLEMVQRDGARSLVDERDYWGVEYNDDELVLVQEAARSRRLLRDSECRARSRINWGYGGSGPHEMAALLVADALGSLAYCPSCFGTIGVSASLVRCPLCENGVREVVWEMQASCNWLTSRLSQSPGHLPPSDNAPPGAQWRLRRTDLLDFLATKVAELAADDDTKDPPGEGEGEGEI